MNCPYNNLRWLRHFRHCFVLNCKGVELARGVDIFLDFRKVEEVVIK